MTDGQTLSFDELVDAVADIQRRRLLLKLMEANPQPASQVGSPDSESEADVDERAISMEHLHLPKLIDLGIIEFASDGQEVVKGPNFDQIRPLLELLDNTSDELPEDWV